jgi:hypothetical protein
MRRRGLNKVWVLALVLLVALGTMGVTYSAWTDDIYIEGSLYTGDINTSVSCNGSCTMDPITEGTTITCSPVLNEPMQLQFSISDAMPGVIYYCNFKINNLDVDTLDQFESLPVKIDDATVTPQETYTGISASVINLPADPQIDPGLSAGGTVRIVVAGDAPAEQDPVFTLEVTVIRWNE